MPTIEISYISLIASTADGTQVLFPTHGHKLKVVHDGKDITKNVGKRLAIVAKKPDGSEVDLKGPQNLKIDKPVFSIKDVTGTPVRPKSEAELFAPGGPGQAILYIKGGKFSAQQARHAQGYETANWEFEGSNPKKSQQLTDTVFWESTNHNVSYHLRDLDKNDPATDIPLGRILSFENRDTHNHPVVPEGDKVRLREINLLYSLVTPPPSVAAIPATRFKGLAPQSLLTRVRQLFSGQKPFENPDRPLCPVGEP